MAVEVCVSESRFISKVLLLAILLTEVLEVEAVVLLIVIEAFNLVLEQDLMVDLVLKEKKRFAVVEGVELEEQELVVEGQFLAGILE